MAKKAFLNPFILFSVIFVSLASFVQFLDFPLLKTVNPSGSILSFWTSVSMIFIYLSFTSKSLKLKNYTLVTALGSQLISLGLYLFKIQSAWKIFAPSSLATTAYIALVGSFLYFHFVSNKSYKFLKWIRPLVVLTPIVFLWATILEQNFLLAIDDTWKGVGTSSYTVASFLFLSVIVQKELFKVFNLLPLKIKSRPILNISIIFVVIFAKFLINPNDAKNFYALTFSTDILVFISYCYLVYFPLHFDNSKTLTVCAWTKKLKYEEDEWLTLDELLLRIGFKVTHGISPEEKARVKAELDIVEESA